MQPFPHPSDATHKIWSRLADWLQRYSSLKVWTTTDDEDGRTDDGPLVYYKLTLWAFCSDELKLTVHPAKTQISLGICPVWSESSLSAGRKLESWATHWADSEDSDAQAESSLGAKSFCWFSRDEAQIDSNLPGIARFVCIFFIQHYLSPVRTKQGSRWELLAWPYTQSCSRDSRLLYNKASWQRIFSLFWVFGCCLLRKKIPTNSFNTISSP